MVKTVSLCVEEGQLVWFQASCTYLGSEYVKVTSVGIKWANLANGHKFNRYTGEVDGGRYHSPATVYASKEEYDRHVRLLAMWKRLQKDIAAHKPLREDITRRRILEVRRLLKLDE